MSGHGWVVPNENGTKARCGGPGLCAKCAIEFATINSPRPLEDDPEPDDGFGPTPTGGEDSVVVEAIKESGRDLLDWIDEQGGTPTDALNKLKNYSMALGKAWASGYAKGLEDGS